MNVIVIIDGREAIPVRAIPFVTGWTMSPDVVASSLAHTDHTNRLEGVAANHLCADGVAPMLPKEWDAAEADLKILSDTLTAKETVEQENYPVWRRESIPLLPPACFLWRDEFENAFHLAYSEDRFTFLDEREGERELNFTPYIPESLRPIVIEGFGMSDAVVEAEKPAAKALTDGERDKFLKQIGGLALALAEKSSRYRVGDKANASQIANAVAEIIEDLPGVRKRGLGKSSLRESIRVGIDLLNK